MKIVYQEENRMEMKDKGKIYGHFKLYIVSLVVYLLLIACPKKLFSCSNYNLAEPDVKVTNRPKFSAK